VGRQTSADGEECDADLQGDDCEPDSIASPWRDHRCWIAIGISGLNGAHIGMIGTLARTLE
jgi:hypothetical protein